MKVIEGGFGKDSFKDNLQIMKANLPDYIEYMSLMATMQKSKYNALIEEGFTEQQALYLCQQVF